MEVDAKYLLSLGSIRDRAKLVGEAAQAGKLSHFDVNEDKLVSTAEFVTSVIKVCLIELIQKLGTNNITTSATLDQTNSTRFHLMVDGNILRLAMCLVLPT